MNLEIELKIGCEKQRGAITNTGKANSSKHNASLQKQRTVFHVWHEVNKTYLHIRLVNETHTIAIV